MYCQFDKEKFFQQQIYSQGYFDYERDGLGEVTHDLESTVNCIVDYLKNGCSLKPTYQKRIQKFFAYHDKNNCQRVYEAIKNISREKESVFMSFPWQLFKRNERVVLYGNSDLVHRYSFENDKMQFVRIVGILEDSEDSIKKLKMLDFDSVLIVVRNPENGTNATNRLMAEGIPADKIKNIFGVFQK